MGDKKSNAKGVFPHAVQRLAGTVWIIAKYALATVGALLLLAVAVILPEIPGAKRFSRYCSYPDKDALIAAESDAVMNVCDYSLNGTNYVVVVMKPCRFLASGPAVLVYGPDGRLFDKTGDEGDDSRFQHTWHWRKSLSDRNQLGTDPTKSIHHRGVSTELVEEAFLNFDDGVMERLSNVGTVFPVEVSSGARLEVLEFVDVDSKETLRLFSATGAVLRAELWARSVRSECRKFSALQAFWMVRVQKPSREGGVGSVAEQPQTSGKWKSKKMLQVDELLPFIDSIRDALDKHLDKREVRRIFGVPNRDTTNPTSSDENGSIWTYEITGLPNNCNSYNLTIGFDADGRLDLWIFSVLKHRMYSIDWFNSDYLLRGDPCLFQ